MRRGWVLGLLALLLLGGLAGCAESDTVAYIDGAPLSADEYAPYLVSAVQDIAYQMDEIPWGSMVNGVPTEQAIKKVALDKAVLRHVLAQKCEEYGITLSDEDIAAIDSQVADFIENMDGSAEYEKYLAELKMTADQYRSIFFEQPVWEEKLFNTLFAADGPAYPTEEQLAKFFSEQFVHATFILISTVDEYGNPLEGDAYEEARRKAQKLLQWARGGQDFLQLVQEYGDESELREDPGRFYYMRGYMRDELDEALFGLEVHEISEAVESEYGFHIFKRLPEDPSYFSTHLDEIRVDYLRFHYLELLDEWATLAEVKTTPRYEKIDPKDYRPVWSESVGE